MTLEDEIIARLRAEIESGPLSSQLTPLVVGGSDSAIADLLNSPSELAPRSRLINARAVLAEYPDGTVQAAMVLDKLESAAVNVPALRWIMSFLKSDSGVDIGHKATQSMLDQLAAGGVITTDEAAKLKSLALKMTSRAELVVGAPVTHEQVGLAMRG